MALSFSASSIEEIDNYWLSIGWLMFELISTV